LAFDRSGRICNSLDLRSDAGEEAGIENQAGPLARNTPSVSVIVPTYKEAESLPLLIERLEALRRQHSLDLELLIMDDNSQDGTSEFIAQKALPWVRLVVRTSNRGLSPSVVDGLALATKEIVLVMDADLSHPPERIPDLVNSLVAGQEFVIGSRYVPGASTDESWGFYRWLNSKIATMMARPFTRLADPMSGFFAFRRSLLKEMDALNPIGYKIGLELLVKSKVKKVAEVPIHFAQRQKGESKLSWKEQLRYIQHVRRLFTYRYPNLSYFLQFIVVGGSGMGVNLLVLTGLLKLQVPVKVAVAVAIGVSMVSNFALNRRFTFSYALGRSIIAQFFGFILACSLGAAINYGVTLLVLRMWPQWSPQLAAIVGILAGTGANFIACRFVVFQTAIKAFPSPPAPGSGPGA
jgi:dolichol-phosphate mannosyltransferase